MGTLRRLHGGHSAAHAGEEKAVHKNGSGKGNGTLVVFGSGGHTAEMLSLLAVLPREPYAPLTFVIADTDSTSEGRAKASGGVPGDAQFLRIPRAREVGQSYLTSLVSTLRAFLACLRLVWSLQPRIILVNGPGTCLPLCLAAAVLRLLGCLRCSIVFVESVCRVRTLSTTGKLLYHARIADQVHVQWPQLAAAYPRAHYVGMLV
jgi:beta-1,4-N-acetylglucosaminyltransferase